MLEYPNIPKIKFEIKDCIKRALEYFKGEQVNAQSVCMVKYVVEDILHQIRMVFPYISYSPEVLVKVNPFDPGEVQVTFPNIMSLPKYDREFWLKHLQEAGVTFITEEKEEEQKENPMIEVSCNVPVYEKNGKEVSGVPGVQIGLKSHWCFNDRVVLVIGEETYTLVANDLHAAITNCTNKGR